MGTWSADILGSDDALDTLGHLGKIIGLPGDQDNRATENISMYPLPNPTDYKTILLISGALERHETTIMTQDWNLEHWPVLAAAYLATGTKMPLPMIAKAMHACHVEIDSLKENALGWSNPGERRKVLKKFVDLIDGHEPGKITRVEHEGLFEKINTHLSTKASTHDATIADIMETIKAASPALEPDKLTYIETKIRDLFDTRG